MADNQALFDDEDEQEYNPNAEEQPVAEEQVQPEPETEQKQPEENNNPYAAYAQEEQKASAFDDEDEDEYKPDYSEPQPPLDQENPYAAEENAHPVGFGAERENLMNQEQIQMPEPQADMQNPYQQTTAPVATSNEEKSEADQARDKLLEDINKLADDNHQVMTDSENVAQDQFNINFKVENPVKVGKIIKYTIAGSDSEGPFEVQRRYNEFHALRGVLLQRWPGCYIPCIPEKKTVGLDQKSGNPVDWNLSGNTDQRFIEERRALLERFIQELARYDFLIESREFKIFSRGAGEVADMLKGLPAQSPIQILEKYRLNFKVDESQDPSEMSKYRTNIQNFTIFLKKAFVNLEKSKKAVKQMENFTAKATENHIRHYYAMMKSEDALIDYYGDGDINHRIITHPAGGEIKTRIIDNINTWKNPFKDAYIWVKGELLDAKGMMDAITGREVVMSQLIKIESKKKSNETELAKLDLGKTTLKSFFKSKTGKEKEQLNLRAQIEDAEQLIEDFKKLINFITIYQGQNAINRYKVVKRKQYLRMLNLFSIREISNAHAAAGLYHFILDVEAGNK